MDKVQKGKICRYLFIEEYGSKSFSFFLFGYFWQKYKNIGLAKIFYIILFQKQMVNFLHWWINFFYIVKQGKNIFLYIEKKVWKTTLFFCPFKAEGEHIFPNCIFICNFWFLSLGFHIIMSPT